MEFKIKRRLEKNGSVIENKENINRENNVIVAIEAILEKYLGYTLSEEQSSEIDELVETIG